MTDGEFLSRTVRGIRSEYPGGIVGIRIDDTRLYKELSQPIEERAVPMVQQLADEAKTVFDAWQARPRGAGPSQ